MSLLLSKVILSVSMKCQKSWQNITICKSNLNCYTNILQGPRWEGAIEISTEQNVAVTISFQKKKKKKEYS